MPLDEVDAVVYSTSSDEMVIHMPNEYDYKLISVGFRRFLVDF
jgi:hypothetical protein